MTIIMNIATTLPCWRPSLLFNPHAPGRGTRPLVQLPKVLWAAYAAQGAPKAAVASSSPRMDAQSARGRSSRRTSAGRACMVNVCVLGGRGGARKRVEWRCVFDGGKENTAHVAGGVECVGR